MKKLIEDLDKNFGDWIDIGQPYEIFYYFKGNNSFYARNQVLSAIRNSIIEAEKIYGTNLVKPFIERYNDLLRN